MLNTATNAGTAHLLPDDIASSKDCAVHLGDNDFECQLRFYAKRSAEIFQIIETVINADRLIRVVSLPPDSPWAMRTVLDWKGVGCHVDAVAIAPYFGKQLGTPERSREVVRWNVDLVLEACRQDIIAQARLTKKLASLAKERGLKLIAYEGGQHLVGSGGEEDNMALQRLFIAANRDPRMKELYALDLESWQKAGGGLHCIFNSAGRDSKWGSWGLLEFGDQDEKSAPKLQGARGFLRLTP